MYALLGRRKRGSELRMTPAWTRTLPQLPNYQKRSISRTGRNENPGPVPLRGGAASCRRKSARLRSSGVGVVFTDLPGLAVNAAVFGHPIRRQDSSVRHVIWLCSRQAQLNGAHRPISTRIRETPLADENPFRRSYPPSLDSQPRPPRIVIQGCRCCESPVETSPIMQAPNRFHTTCWFQSQGCRSVSLCSEVEVIGTALAAQRIVLHVVLQKINPP